MSSAVTVRVISARSPTCGAPCGHADMRPPRDDTI
jgi:hypothetical protein